MTPAVIRKGSESTKRRHVDVKLPPGIREVALARELALAEQLRYLQRLGISVRVIARELGASEREVHAWKSGQFNPSQPRIAYTIEAWAEFIKARRAVAPLMKHINKALARSGKTEGV